MARSRPRNLGRRDLLSGAVAYASPAQWTVLVLTLTLVGALLVVSGRRQPAGSGELQVSPGFGQIERAAGHEVHFMESQQNLKQSDLLEVPIEDSNEIFKGRPSPDANLGSNALDLTKNGDGFLSNVAEARKGAVEANETAAPSGDAKPLGFYFSKDIPGHVKEKALGTRNRPPSAMPTGKAAMGLYFNKDNKESERSDPRDATTQIGASVAEGFISASETRQSAGASTDRATSSDVESFSVQNSMHRKELRGITMGAQGMQDQHSAESQGIPENRAEDAIEEQDSEEAHDGSRSSLVIAISSSAGQYKPLTKKASLNTDDM